MNREASAPETAETKSTPRGRALSHWLLLGLLLLVAAELRFGAVALSVFDPPVNGDSVKYISAAYNLRYHGVFSSVDTWNHEVAQAPVSDAFLPVGYPALLAILLDGHPDYAFLRRVLLLQVLLGTLAVGAGYLLARAALGREWALAIAFLLAICPQLISLGTSVFTEVPYALLATAFLLALANAARTPRSRAFAIAGALLGLGVLVRMTLLYLPLVLLPAIAWLLPANLRWRCASAFLLGFAVVYGPWLARNEIALGRSGDPTLMVNAILDGSYPDLMYQGRSETRAFPYRFDPGAADVRTPRQAIERVAANLRGDPAGTLRWYLFGKPLRFYDWEFAEGAGDIFMNPVKRTPYRNRAEFAGSYALMRALHWPLIALSYLGIALAVVVAMRHRGHVESRVWGLLATVMVFAIGVHVIGFPLGRYSVPFRALTWLFAMLPLALAARRWSRKGAA